MAFCAWIIAIAVFLSVITAIVFVMLVIGIRKGDRARHLSDGPETVLDAVHPQLSGRRHPSRRPRRELTGTQ